MRPRFVAGSRTVDDGWKGGGRAASLFRTYGGPVMIEANEKLVAPRPKAIYWIASFALAGVLLYYSLRGIEWGRVWSIVRGAQPRAVALALAVSSFTLFLRAVRWRVLLLAKGNVSVPLAF